MVSRPSAPDPPGAARADRHTQTLGQGLCAWARRRLCTATCLRRVTTVPGLRGLGTMIEPNARATGRGKGERPPSRARALRAIHCLQAHEGARRAVVRAEHQKAQALCCGVPARGPNPSFHRAESAKSNTRSQELRMLWTMGCFHEDQRRKSESRSKAISKADGIIRPYFAWSAAW
jgi:hypothetical protein